jgi:hypothetical protein
VAEAVLEQPPHPLGATLMRAHVAPAERVGCRLERRPSRSAG